MLMTVRGLIVSRLLFGVYSIMEVPSGHGTE